MKIWGIAFVLCLLFASGVQAEEAIGDTMTTSSGLRYIVLAKGEGRKAESGEIIIAHYTGSLLDGKVFDSSRERGEPFSFPLGQKRVIKGWDEAFSLLNVGSRAILIIPPDLAYGNRKMGEAIPANSTLVFDVELLDIKQTSVGIVLSRVLERKGRAAAIKEFYRMKDSGFAEAYMSEQELNALGYGLIQKKLFGDAIAMLNLNVETYPNSFNVHDSIAEAYMLNGDTELAIEHYQKSLELNPQNTNAVEMLQKLKK